MASLEIALARAFIKSSDKPGFHYHTNSFGQLVVRESKDWITFPTLHNKFKDTPRHLKPRLIVFGRVEKPWAWRAGVYVSAGD